MSSRSYLRQIEQTYLDQSGSGIMLSPRDLDLALRWEAAGVPVDVVIGAIRQAFAESTGKRRERGLASMTWRVDRAAKEWRERSVGVAQTAADVKTPDLTTKLDRVLDRIERAGREVSHAVFKQALRGMWREVRELRQRVELGLVDDVVDPLVRLEREVLREVYGQLDDETRQRVDKRVEQVLGQTARALDRDARVEARGHQQRKIVRAEMGVPDLVLALEEPEW